MGLKCGSCSSTISRKQVFVTCLTCKTTCHIECVGLTDVPVTNNWTCTYCAKISSLTPLIMSSQVENSGDNNEFTIADLNKAIQSMNSDVNNLKVSQHNFESTLTSIGSQLNTIVKMSQLIEDHDDRIKHLENTNKSQQQRIMDLNRRLDNLEQSNRCDNIQIDGIPLTSNENLRDVIIKLAAALNVQLKMEDITYVGRVRSVNSKKIKPVICSISKAGIISNLTKASRKLKPTAAMAGFANNNNGIFINEHLTVARKQLLYKAKSFKTSNNFEYLWVKDGRIYLKKNNNTEAINIDVSTDFSKLI